MPQVHAHDPETGFAIVSVCAKMPNSCRGTYRKVRVVRLATGADPERLTYSTGRDSLIVFSAWGSHACNVGRTPRSAFGRMLCNAAEVYDACITEARGGAL